MDNCLKVFQNTEGKIIITKDRRRMYGFGLFTCGSFASCKNPARTCFCLFLKIVPTLDFLSSSFLARSPRYPSFFHFPSVEKDSEDRKINHR